MVETSFFFYYPLFLPWNLFNPLINSLTITDGKQVGHTSFTSLTFQCSCWQYYQNLVLAFRQDIFHLNQPKSHKESTKNITNSGWFISQISPIRNEFSTCWKIIASFIYFPFSGLFVILCLKRFSWMLMMISSMCRTILNQCKKMFPFLIASWTWEIQLQSKIAKRLKDISLVNCIITFY